MLRTSDRAQLSRGQETFCLGFAQLRALVSLATALDNGHFTPGAADWIRDFGYNPSLTMTQRMRRHSEHYMMPRSGAFGDVQDFASAEADALLAGTPT